MWAGETKPLQHRDKALGGQIGDGLPKSCVPGAESHFGDGGRGQLRAQGNGQIPQIKGGEAVWVPGPGKEKQPRRGWPAPEGCRRQWPVHIPLG